MEEMIEYEPYQEKKRERRIRDRNRMIKRAYRFIRRDWYPDECNPNLEVRRPWDKDGHDPEAMAWKMARRIGDYQKICSCHSCGNPRKFFGHITRQEKKAKKVTDTY